MQEENSTRPVGSLRISHDVIATIASCATAEIEGVASLAPYARSINTLKRVLFKSQVTDSISVELRDDVAVIGVYINLRYGARIPAVAERVQHAVKEAVQTMTGLTVQKVNVYVVGVTFDEPSQEENM